MTQNTLYLKYRPQDFLEVLGQDQIVQTLQKSIKNKTFAHSYLFSGSRGTGKTSIARIFSKSLGVENEDIYEIDAASNRGISEIREIRDSVEILPLKSEYKIYIIDEVHMLTKEAFNALLKTLEEPPKSVIFILATTEKHKILDTIISRCTVLDFKKPSILVLRKLIEDVCKKEKRKIDSPSIDFIAKKGDGSFRDTLSFLQKTFSFFEKDIVFPELQKELGLSVVELEDEFIKSLSEKDKEKSFLVWKNVLDQGVLIDNFILNILKKIRVSLLIKNSQDFLIKYSEILSKDELDFLQSLNLTSLDLKKILDLSLIFEKSNFQEIEFEIFLNNYFLNKDG